MGDKRHKHNTVYSQADDPTQANERCHIWKFCLQHMTQKSRNSPLTIHSGKQQNQLPWRSCNTNGRNAGGKTAIQQLHINQRSALHGNGHIKLLPHDTTPLTQIHQNKIKRHPGGNNHQIQATQTCYTRQQCLHNGKQSHVRDPTGWTACK